MKLFISISLIFSFCFLSMRSAMVFSYFKYNQEYITANFCVNKNIKESKCKGACRLKDLMKADDKKNQSPTIPIIPNLQIEEFFPIMDGVDSILSLGDNHLSNKNYSYLFPADQLAVQGIFHPPRYFFL